MGTSFGYSLYGIGNAYRAWLECGGCPDSACGPKEGFTMKRATLPNTHTSPPGEFQYRVPQTGQFFRASNWPQLQEQLIAHYRATGYPAPANLYEAVEDFICANHP